MFQFWLLSFPLDSYLGLGKLGRVAVQISYSWPFVPLQAYGRPSKAKALVANIKLQQQRNGAQSVYIVPPSVSAIASQTYTVFGGGGGGGVAGQQQQYSTLANVLAVKFIPKLL